MVLVLWQEFVRRSRACGVCPVSPFLAWWFTKYIEFDHQSNAGKSNRPTRGDGSSYKFEKLCIIILYDVDF